MKTQKRLLLDQLSKVDLSHLGTPDELKAYLQEEFRELDLSDRWNTISSMTGVNLPNPNNVLLYYLNGTHVAPAKLEHHYSGGDFPDIDCDYEPDRREEIKQFLRDTFGEANCMEVSTFGGTHIKGAIQDLARIEGVDPQEVFKVTTSINYNVNNEEENTLEYVREHYAEVAAFLAQHPKVEDWVEKMQEVKRSIGKHASAFIVANKDIQSYIPIILSTKKEPITGFPESSSVKALQGVGLVKFDILGVENLTVVRETEELIQQRHGITIDWDKVDLNDRRSYELLRKGFNAGLFQADSNVASMIVQTIQPTEFRDLVALNSMIRPACLKSGAHEAYKLHKQGKQDRKEYPVWLELKGKISDKTYQMLDRSYGIVLFQEQTQAMLAEFCGVPFDETNKMRKIIGIPANKKSQEHFDYIKKQQERWMKYGAEKFGEVLAAQWWETAVGSLSYGFNLSHSTAYSVLTFRQMYLKAHYPAEFYVALLRTAKAEADDTGRNKLMKYIIEAKHLGVRVQSPHINKSKESLVYDTETEAIYVGFKQIKGIGDAAARDIVARGPYTSLDDFVAKHKGKDVERSGVNKTVINALIVTNAFRDFEDRMTLLERYRRSLLPKKKQADPIEMPTKFGIFLEEHACLTIVLSQEKPIPMQYGYLPITKAVDTGKDRECKIKGIIDSISWQTSKKGSQYAKLIVNDLEDSAIVLAWSNHSKKVKALQSGDLVSLKVTHLDGSTFSLVKIESIEREESNDEEAA